MICPSGKAKGMQTQTVDFQCHYGRGLDGSDHNLDTANSISVRNLSFDRISRARRNSNELLNLSIQLRNAIEPKLAFVGGVDDSIVLN